MKTCRSFILPVVLVVLSVPLIHAQDWQPVPVAQDPLLRMPGTQPAQGVRLESPNRCLNCHAGYNTEVEPGHNWQGSMMAQAARDFLFWSCLTVAGQDSIWALGTPNAVDLCERCHFPAGWLGGRSDPPNASAMTGADFDGVHCDFCHTGYDPFSATTYNGTREGNDWLNYWDETNLSATPSQPAANATLQQDQSLAGVLTLFNGGLLYQPDAQGLLVPFSTEYTEAGSGQYYVSGTGEKRASFADAAARHQMLYSRFHKSHFFCSTCHDVSNPALANLYDDPTLPLTSERKSAFSYYHVERTFSEFRISAYGQQGGAAGKGPFAPEVFNTSVASNNVSRCQDCHLRDVVGQACNKNGALVRPTESVEHPQSGLPLHDMTGGNMFVSAVLASTVSGSPNYDAYNAQQLSQGAAVLTLDLSQGLGISPVALLDGVSRARQQLELAATIENLNYDAATGAISFRVQNQAGHRLISGFPEGRRMFVNIKAYDAGGALVYEVNPFDAAAGTLKGLDHTYADPDTTLPPLPGPQAIAPTHEAYADDLVYEMHPKSTLTGEAETFHFALADGQYKDNRIPPKGYQIVLAAARKAEPVWHGAAAPTYFTDAEYAGGYDDVTTSIATGASSVVVTLLYQTTSREYIEFLRNEINGTGSLTLASPSPLTGLAAYRVQTDPFFGQLKAWGNVIWLLWKHNYQAGVAGAVPVQMAQASVGVSTACTAPVPVLLSAVAGNSEVTISWTDEAAGDPSVLGYNIYHDQAGKLQSVATVDATATWYTESGLTNGQQTCYRVTSYNSDCESDPSNDLCATPDNQALATANAATIATGMYQRQGKLQVFVSQNTFTAGTQVVIQTKVIDSTTALPISNAKVTLSVSGPETVTLTSGPSGTDGIAEATWSTSAPNHKGNGGTTPGSYTATVTALTASGYTWDGQTISTTFTIQ